MQSKLFTNSIHDFSQEKLRESVRRAEALTEQELLVAELAPFLDKISDFPFQVAKLKPDGRKGKRRTEKRERTDYGLRTMVDVDFIDVTIPFEGFPKSLTIAPSSCHVIDVLASVENGQLVVTFPDDDNLDPNVNDFIKRDSENLDRQRQEIETIKQETRKAVSAVANRRIAEIKARKERDKARSFPIE